MHQTLASGERLWYLRRQERGGIPMNIMRTCLKWLANIFATKGGEKGDLATKDLENEFAGSVLPVDLEIPYRFVPIKTDISVLDRLGRETEDGARLTP